MLRNFLKTTFRNLARNKVFTSINIAGLSMGLASAMLIILFIKDEYSYDRFHQNAQQIFRIDRKITRSNGEIATSGYSGYFHGPRFSAGVPGIKTFVRLMQGTADLRNGQNVFAQEVHYVDPGFFQVFSFPLLYGDKLTVLQQPNTTVISESMALRQFGKADVVGKTIQLKVNGKFEPVVIEGVAADCPANSSIKFDMLIPLRVSPEDENNNENWFSFFLNTFVVVDPHTNMASINEGMQKVFEADAKETIRKIKETYHINDPGVSFFLQPLTDIHLSKKAPAEGLSDAGNPVHSYMLSGIAIFILLIACINFINLTVARSVKRAKEIGIRKVIGSDRKQLLLQFFGESFILCSIAFALALVWVQLALPLFNSLSGKSLALSYLLDSKLVAAYLTLLLLICLSAGIYPSLVLSSYNPVQVLYNRSGGLTGKNILQQSLVVIQFSLASFLIIGTLTSSSQFDFLTTQHLGYDDNNLISVQHWGTDHTQASLFKNELLKHPSITGVAPKNYGLMGNTVLVENERQINITNENIDTGFFSIMKIPFIVGRNFSTPADESGSVIVNEAFVKAAGWQDPIGKQVRSFEKSQAPLTVIGVVKDYHYRPLTSKVEPQIFTINPTADFGIFYIRIRPHTETESLSVLANTFKALFPLSPYAYAFTKDDNARNYAMEERWKRILRFSAVLTIFISCIGLFGLTVSAAERRVREIGIRKTLGSSTSNIIMLLSGDFLKLVVISLIIAIPASWYMASKWLENYPYRIQLGWGIFILASIIVVALALVTTAFQSVRAALANPVKSLRTE